jgi:acyl dehydratase
MVDEWYFENIEVGQTVRTRQRVLTPSEMDIIPQMSGALHPLFYSDAWAIREFGRTRRQAMSTLGLALAVGLLCQAGLFREALVLARWSGVNFFHDHSMGEGDLVYAEAEVAAKRDVDNHEGEIEVLITLRHHTGERILEGAATVRVSRRESSNS